MQKDSISQSQGKGGKRPSLRKQYILAISGSVLVLLTAAATLYFWKEVQDLGHYGYLGAFVISILGGATIFIPIPAMAIVFALGGVMKYPLLVGGVAGLGEALGEVTAYFGGLGGGPTLQGKYASLYSRLERWWMKRRGAVALFLFAAVPNPIFYFTGALAGALRYPLWKFFLLTWMGKTVKNIGVAFAGYWGLRIVLRWLGMPD